jgi:hypothetical protein
MARRACELHPATGNTMEAHLAYYRSNIVAAMRMEPLMINVQSGWYVHSTCLPESRF